MSEVNMLYVYTKVCAITMLLNLIFLFFFCSLNITEDVNKCEYYRDIAFE